MKISVIIPTYNEAENIGSLIKSCQKFGGSAIQEIIVVDSPASSDNLAEIVQNNKATFIKSPKKGRAAQMNFGAKIATGKILYFVHADTKIHPDFVQDLEQAVKQNFDLGCYRFQFDSDRFPLKINAFFTRFNKIWCRGGDQTLFITHKKFIELGGFNDNFLLMEDFDIIIRAKEKGLRFKIIPKNVVVSARKYETNSYLTVQITNFRIMRMYLKGTYSQAELAEIYKKLLNHR